MKLFRLFLDFFLYSNIFISVCAAAMTTETYLLIYSEINWLYVTFVFFSTLVLYNFPTFIEDNFSSEQSERHEWIVKSKKLLAIISVIAFIATGVIVFLFPFKFILCFAPIAVIGFAYFFPQTQLRKIAGLKAAIVALVWTSVTVVYPLVIISGYDFVNFFQGENKIIVLQNFFFIFPLCVIFNVRDIEADKKAGVKTFPSVYGLKRTIAVCMISLIIFSILIFYYRKFSYEAFALFASAIISAIFILKATPDKNDYYYSFWIDGMILLQAGLVLAIKLLTN